MNQRPHPEEAKRKDAPGKENKVVSLEERVENEAKSYLEKLLSEGARKLLQSAIENEVTEYLQSTREQRTETGRRAVVRNGYHPERELVSGIGPIKVQQPRVHNRGGQRFSSAILPPYLRRVPSIDALIPALYLKGISTGDFTEALEAILGERAIGLSATNIVRLKAEWEVEYKDWNGRDLSQKRYVYWWADGIYFNVRLDEERSCVLVLMGALEDGTKELIAVVDGYRESIQSWRELLQQLKRQGLTVPPKLAVGDGSLGFWLALQEEYGPVPQQRCWVHKTANILDKMPKSVQGRAKALIHEMYLSPTRKSALAAYDQFITSYQAKYPKATECLEKDKDWLFSFYDFPAQHWALQAKGANEDFLTEPAFADLVLRNVLSKHQNEIRDDPGLAEAVFMAFFKKASPSDFRHLAAKDREKGNHELAYLFEMCADHRERGEI